MFKKSSPLDLPSRRSALLRELAETEKALEALRAKAIAQAAAGGEPPALAATEQKAWQAEFHRTTLLKALEQVEAAILAAEEMERQRADEALRTSTAAELSRLADALGKAVLPFAPVCEGLLETFQTTAHLFGPSGLPQLLTNMAREVPAAIETYQAELRARATQTLAGSAPARLPVPFVPEIVPPVPQEPTLQVFALASLSWLDGQGGREHCGSIQIRALPVKAAQTALKRGLALELNSQRYADLKEGAKKHGWPDLFDPLKTYDLTPPEETITANATTGKLKHHPVTGQFQVIDRGPPRTVQISRPPEPQPLPREEF